MNDRVVYQWGERLLNETASAIVPMIGDIVYLPVAEKNYFGKEPTYPFRVVKRSFRPRPMVHYDRAEGTTVFIEVIRMEDDDE